jgi:hypothetical protein
MQPSNNQSMKRGAIKAEKIDEFAHISGFSIRSPQLLATARKSLQIPGN